MKIFFKIKNTFFLPHTLKTDSQVRNFGVIQIQKIVITYQYPEVVLLIRARDTNLTT